MKPSMDKITILPDHTKQLWTAHYTDPVIQELFGTNTIPTPYTLVMSKTEVINLIQELNPESTVN